jgi:hypothetical protein
VGEGMKQTDKMKDEQQKRRRRWNKTRATGVPEEIMRTDERQVVKPAVDAESAKVGNEEIN